MRIAVALLLIVGLTGCGRARSSMEWAEAEATVEETPAAPVCEAPDLGGFRFPDDRGGKLLADLLPPKPPRTVAEPASAPRRLPPPRTLEAPELPLPPNLAPPALAVPKTGYTALRPRSPSEDLPRPDPRDELAALPALPAGARVRLTAPDVNRPAPLPYLGQKQAENSAAEDGTAEASTLAATTAKPPQRGGPAPFARLTVPDPFEHRRTPPATLTDNKLPDK